MFPEETLKGLGMEHLFAEFMYELFGVEEATSIALFPTLQWLLASIIGAAVVLWLYATRNFNDQVTYSANLLVPHENGFQLQLRTLEVLPKEDLLPSNLWFRIRLFFAIRKCTVKDPFIRMSHADMDVLQPAIINGLSRLFAEGIVAEMRGEKPTQQLLLMGITYEKYGAAKTRKIRVMVVSEEVLNTVKRENIFFFERGHEKDRIKTLQRMAAHYSGCTWTDGLCLVRPVYAYTCT